MECLTSANAEDIIKKYDVVLDATDNVATRYLLNDACVLLKKPLVSGSALRYKYYSKTFSLDVMPNLNQFAFPDLKGS